MPTKYVEYDLDDLEDEELIDELSKRGYFVIEDYKIEDASFRLFNDNLRESLIIIERAIPVLKGLVDALDKIAQK